MQGAQARVCVCLCGTRVCGKRGACRLLNNASGKRNLFSLMRESCAVDSISDVLWLCVPTEMSGCVSSLMSMGLLCVQSVSHIK